MVVSSFYSNCGNQKRTKYPKRKNEILLTINSQTELGPNGTVLWLQTNGQIFRH
jgi:hypothetical protein